MFNFEIIPKSGVGPIWLGMPRREVRAVLGEPQFSRENKDRFLSGFHVHYDESQFVEFIELARSEQFTTSFHGKCLHSIPGDEAVVFVSQFGNVDSENSEVGYSFIFPTLEMSLWRSVLPDSSNDEDCKYFEAIGVGRMGYFSE